MQLLTSFDKRTTITSNRFLSIRFRNLTTDSEPKSAISWNVDVLKAFKIRVIISHIAFL